MNWLKKLINKNTINGNKSQDIPSDNDEVAKLSRLLTNVLSLAQLRDLCSILDVRFEYLPGDSKAAKAEELVLYFTHPPRSLDQFIQTCSQLYPDIPWDDPDSIESQSPNTDRVTMLKLINYCFNVNELRDLCLDLAINYDNLPGANKQGKVIDLVAHYSRFPRNLDQLRQACTKLRPNAPWESEKITKYEPYSRSALVKLRWMLEERFDDAEVRKLGEDLGVNYKYFPRLDERGTAREIISYLARRERLHELVETCTHQFPDVPWQETLDLSEEQQSDEKVPEPIESISLRQNLSSFSEDNLRDICFEMGIDYDNIAGLNQVGELISYCKRRGRIPELVVISRRLHPDIQW